MKTTFIKKIMSLRLPVLCTLCNQYYQGTSPLCTACRHLITPLGHACKICAEPLPDKLYLICGACIKSPPTLTSVITAYRYQEPLRTLLHEFKYHEGLFLTSFLSTLMQDANYAHATKNTECLIPIPMHPSRLKARGFNQATLLAKNLSNKLKIPYDLKCCQKIKNTPSQATLTNDLREQNVRDAFYVRPVSYKHVTLIDDLVTTGYTANELAKMLKKQGVQTVNLWCCARA